MKRVILGILLTLWVSFASAAAVPAYTGKVNNSIGSILNSKIAKTAALGPEYDAKFQRTMDSITSGLTGAATTLVAGGAAVALGAVSWPALLASAAISGVVSGAVSLGMNELIKWYWPDRDHPNQTKIEGSGMGAGDPSNFAIMPSDYPTIVDNYGPGADVWFAKDSTYKAARHFRTVRVTCPSATIFCKSQDPHSVENGFVTNMVSTFDAPFVGTITSSSTYWNARWNRVVSGQPATTYDLVYEYVPPTTVTLLPPSYVGHWQSPGQSINDLPQSYVTQPLSDQQLAAIANAVWQAASATQTQGDTFVYDAANPITAADIAVWRAVNPQLVPTVNDFISPVAAPGTSAVLVPNPATQGPAVVVPGVTPDSASGGSENLDINWGEFKEPDLDTPTIESILDPIFNLWPEWTHFVFPPHSSSCPSPQFDLWGHTFTFDQMCQWIEMIRPAMQSAFAVMWAALVVFIVMGA